MEKYYLYIVLTRTNTLISKLLQLLKKDEYTHAAISLNLELDCMYSFGRKFTYYPFVGRFKKEEVNKGLNRLHKNLPGVILEIEVSKQQYKRVNDLLEIFVSNSTQYKYNYTGLLYGIFNKTACYEDRFSCSEFVYYILNESGILDLKMSRSLVRPQNLLHVDSETIYKGNLKDMKYQMDFNRSIIYDNVI